MDSQRNDYEIFYSSLVNNSTVSLKLNYRRIVQNYLLDRSCSERTLEVVGWWCVSRKRQLNYVLCLYFDGLRVQHNGLRCNKTDMNGVL